MIRKEVSSVGANETQRLATRGTRSAWTRHAFRLLVAPLLVGTLVGGLPTWQDAHADTDFKLRKQLTVRGGIALIGNAQTHCQTAVDGAKCTNEKGSAPAHAFQNYEFASMDFVNVDGGTSNSSIASLTLPAGATVKNAYLYWGAWSDGTAVIDGGRSNRGVVRLKVPGGAYQDVTASTTYTSLVAQAAQPCDPDETAAPADGAAAISPKVPPNLVGGAGDLGYTLYESVAEVTNLLPGSPNGNYSVADIVGVVGSLAATGGTKGDDTGRFGLGDANDGGPPVSDTNCIAGWTLAVLYEDPAEVDYRSLNLYDGLVGVSNGASTDTTVSGFSTPAAGAFEGQVGMVTYDGDFEVTGDFFRIDGNTISNAANAANNFFNSTNTRQDLDAPFSIDIIGFAPSDLINGADLLSPANANQLGFDIDTVVEDEAVFGNSTTSLTLTFGTAADFYLAGLFFLDIPTDTADLAIAKSVVPSTVALGETLTFTIVVTNNGLTNATGVVMRDPKDDSDTLTLNTPHEVFPDGLFITDVSTSQGTCSIKNTSGVVQHGPNASLSGLNANNENMLLDCALGTIVPAGSVTITLEATVGTAFLNGGNSRSYTNIASAQAEQGNPVEANGSANAAITGEDVLIAGRVWEDADHDRVLDGSETLVSGWTVNILDATTKAILGTQVTDADGRYSFVAADIAGYVSGTAYDIDFVSHTGVAMSKAVSNIQTGQLVPPGDDDSFIGRIESITLTNGTNVIEQNFPLDPGGVVYDSTTGNPVAGATVSITGPVGFNPDTMLGAGQKDQITGADGSYRFDLVNGAPVGTYTVTVTPPAGYLSPSTTIAPSGTLTVDDDPEVVVANNAPNIAGVTTYYLDWSYAGALTPVVNNHIPLDPVTNVANNALTKTVTPGTVALGEVMKYTMVVTNTGPQPATNAVLRDPQDIADTLAVLDNPHEVFPTGFFVTGVTTTQGTCALKDATGAVQHAAAATLSNLTTDNENVFLDCALGTIPVDGTVTVVLTAKIDTTFLGVASTTSYTNTAYTESSESETTLVDNAASATINAETVLIAGRVWNDDNHDRVLDEDETLRSGYIVNILDTASGRVLATKTTDSDGRYSFTTADIAPGTYNVQFVSPTGSTLSKAVSNIQEGEVTPPGDVDTTVGTISSITLVGGDNIIEQNFPLDPSGIVYDSNTGAAIAGATVIMSGPAGFDPNLHLAPGQQNQVTGVDGFYRFDINQAAGAPNGVYTITVVPPSGYSFISSVIPPTATLDVPSSAIIDPYLVVANNLPNIAGVTTYHLTFLFDGNDTNVLNNHIPLDPSNATNQILITKTTPKVTVVKGDLVPYTLTARNVSAAMILSTSIVDTLPPGFKYVSGTALIDGVATEPTVSGRTLTWSLIDFDIDETHTIDLVAVVGAGVNEGKYVNQAQVFSVTDVPLSNIASATVIVTADPIMDCTDIIGTVFHDANGNAYQDQGEQGIPGVRVVTVNGLKITTDQYGRYHIACADIPQIDHGSNFILKVDERTLPTGFRMTSENPRVVRATRGKLIKANFAAGPQSVIRVQVDARAFKGDTVELQDPWANDGIDRIVAALLSKGQLGVLRLVYWTDGEGADLAEDRFDWMVDKISERWAAEDDRPPLTIEREIRTRATTVEPEVSK